MGVTWGRVTTGRIARAIQGGVLSGDPDTRIAGVGTDTRALAPGRIFWALHGERFDGHDFLDQALERGAAGIVAEADRLHARSFPENAVVISVKDTLRALGDLARWWRHAHRVEVAALTGSAGKTTTKEMAAGILALDGEILRNPGNFNNLIGLPLTLLDLREEHRRAVLEMGMNHPGEIARLTEIADPDVGLITNVARAHLEGLGDVHAVARAKAELLDGMAPKGTAVLNGDDTLLMKEAHRFSGRVVTFGLKEEGDVWAEKVQDLGREGVAFVLHYENQRSEVRLNVPGRQNVMNALAAAALSFSMGSPVSSVVRGLAAFQGIPGRFSLLDLPGGGLLVDDTYNANPSSLRAALDSLAPLVREQGRVIAGLGDMLELGRETVSAHFEAGRMAAERGVHEILVLGDHADEVVRGAVEGGLPSKRTRIVRTHKEMADGICELLREGDVVLLKASRGMRLDRVVELLTGMEKGGTSHGREEKGPGGG
ncbi:MAG: UDP-N-acetylmuramoyl-tripeptide--D-alanyl-D-alanine ligase [Desulfobacteraceae bacterium]|jgi:UDP-N-acetylmuramoyl-tripeptide--D-alanyl-D-alanine ligase